MYRVMKFFTDLQDNDHPYKVGDIFPREGIEVTEKRLKELSGDSNKQGKPLIGEVVEEAEAKPVKPARATRGRAAAEKE